MSRVEKEIKTDVPTEPGVQEVFGDTRDEL
jgi:hypothetical protein